MGSQSLANAGWEKVDSRKLLDLGKIIGRHGEERFGCDSDNSQCNLH